MSAPLFCHVKEETRHVLRHWLMVNEYVGYWWSVFEVADEPPPPLGVFCYLSPPSALCLTVVVCCGHADRFLFP